VTQNRHHLQKGDIQRRCRDLVVQICHTENENILKRAVIKDHVFIHVEYPPSLNVSDIVKKIKGRTFRLLQKEFPAVGKKYGYRHCWAVGYGAWSRGNITDEMVQYYLEHHSEKLNVPKSNRILE